MSRTRGIAVLLGLSLWLAGVALAAEVAKGALDGKSYSGMLGEKGKTKGDKDDFVFKEGTFHSTACDAYGFGAAAYTAREEAGAIAFEATTHSAKEGDMEWKGAVKGDAVEGTVVWKKAGKAPKDYWFKGTLKK